MTLQETLQDLESNARSLFGIESHFRKHSSPDVPDSLELLAEKMAFDFQPDYNHDVTGWDTYYGPQMVWNNHDGTANIWPHYSKITHETIEYWKKRINECKNPLMVSRYADVVWDFHYKILQTKPNYEIAQTCIEAYIAAADLRMNKNNIESFQGLERALSIAIKLNKKELVSKCKEAIISFESYAARDESPGLWGHSFDLLVQNNKVTLTDDEERLIISGLENILSRACTIENANSWAAENAVKRLVKYYASKQSKIDTRRVLLSLENAYRLAGAEESAMQKAHWLTSLSSMYEANGFPKDEKRLLVELREGGSKVDEEMKSIPFEFQITKDEIDSIINPQLTGNINEILYQIMLTWIPRKKIIEKGINERGFFLMSLFNTIVYDDKGRAIGALGSKENNFDRHLAHEYAQHMNLQSIFINLTFQGLKDLHNDTAVKIIEFLKDCPIIRPERLTIIEQALVNHFAGNYLVSLHLLIPQLEECIRYLIETAEGNILRANKIGGYYVKTFDEVLQDPIVNKVLGEDITMYFRMLFTHQLGWNLRNKIMHGLAEPNFFNIKTSERVIHALLCLKLIRVKPR